MDAQSVEQFVEQCCDQGPREKEAVLSLWDAYLRWCARGEQLQPEEFLQELSGLGLKARGGYVVGVKLKSALPEHPKQFIPKLDGGSARKRKPHEPSLLQNTEKSLRNAMVLVQKAGVLLEALEATMAESAALLEESMVVLEEGMCDRGRRPVLTHSGP